MFAEVPGAPWKVKVVKIRAALVLAKYTESAQCDVKNNTTNVKAQRRRGEITEQERTFFSICLLWSLNKPPECVFKKSIYIQTFVAWQQYSRLN